MRHLGSSLTKADDGLGKHKKTPVLLLSKTFTKTKQTKAGGSWIEAAKVIIPTRGHVSMIRGFLSPSKPSSLIFLAFVHAEDSTCRVILTPISLGQKTPTKYL